MSIKMIVVYSAICAFLCGATVVAQPLVYVDLPNPALVVDRPGNVIRVSPAESLQTVLNRAGSGDVIVLEAGGVYQGPFILRRHTGPGWITITSSANETYPLPTAGNRVSPAHASAMATLVSTVDAVISTDPAAARYHFIGIEIRPGHTGILPDHVTGTRRAVTNLVNLGSGNNSQDEMPHHIVFERSYLHGDPVLGTRCGIVLNGAHMAVIDSHLSGFKSVSDSQAIVGWEGTGPFLIQNNYLEATGENIMFGGADPAIENRVPSDIVIIGNHLSKPLSWKNTHESYDGSNWSIKNLLELKNASRVLIEGNLLEHNWVQSQSGFAVLFTVRNQDGHSPWSRIEDVKFTNNIVRFSGGGVNILGYDDIHESGRAQRIEISNNLFYEIGGEWGSGRLFQLLNSPANIIISHNSAFQSDAILIMEGDQIPGVEMRNNIFLHNAAGISGTNTAPGQNTISAYLSAPLKIDGNILIGPGSAPYREGMTHVGSLSGLPFTSPATGDFRMSQWSMSGRSVPIQIPGVNFEKLCSALSISDRPSYC